MILSKFDAMLALSKASTALNDISYLPHNPGDKSLPKNWHEACNSNTSKPEGGFYGKDNSFNGSFYIAAYLKRRLFV